ncbi:MAG: DoxX family protein [Cyclobacteriaceae bacterium]
MKTTKLIAQIPRLIVAFVLLQTLYFKFGIGGEAALAESKDIFGAIALAILGNADYESYLRIGTGLIELVASILILINRTAIFGALLAVGLMAGAILSHLLFIGIEVMNDGGQLFMMAIIVLLAASKVFFDERHVLLNLLAKK